MDKDRRLGIPPGCGFSNLAGSMAWSRFISVAMLRRCVDSDEWLKPSETALFKPPKGGGGHLSSDEDSDNRFFMPPERDSDAEPSVLLVLGDVDVGFE